MMIACSIWSIQSSPASHQLVLGQQPIVHRADAGAEADAHADTHADTVWDTTELPGRGEASWDMEVSADGEAHMIQHIVEQA